MIGEAILSEIYGPAVVAMIASFIALFVMLFIALYIYMALAMMTIAQKLKRKDIAWLAWIPIANMFLIPILAKKNWPWGFMFLVPIANIVFGIIWTWSIFEQRKYPGWLSLIVLAGIIPFIGWLATLANLIIWGLVAWKDL